MMLEVALVLLYARSNRYSFNALVGALETAQGLLDLDVRFCRDGSELSPAISDALGAGKKVLVGISFATPQLWGVHPLVRQLENEFGTAITLLAGGPHPTGDARGTLRLGFDIAVCGEGEETLIDLVRATAEGKDIREVRGIAFLGDSGDARFTGDRPALDLDRYPSFAPRHQKFGPIEITRGCPFVCGYCQTSHIFGTRARHRSVESIVKHVEAMCRRGLKDVRVITPNAFSYGSPDGRSVNIQLLDRLLSAVRGVIGNDGRIFFGSFPSEVRPEHVTDDTVSLVRQYADNDNLIMGAQSGSQRVLDLCNRGHSVPDVYNAVGRILEAGLKANVDFIFGLPGETREDVESTVLVMEELARMGARIHAHTFMPLPQTKFAKAGPGRIPKAVRALVRKLVPQGKFYGDWRQQEIEARRIARYLRTGHLGEEE